MDDFQRFAADFQALGDEPSIDIKISPMGAWALIAQLQLALRHPQNHGHLADYTRNVAQKLQSKLNLPLHLEEVLSRGWLKEYDAKIGETNEEYLKRITPRKIIEVYNAYALYSPNNVMCFSRPQDWGNKKSWAYERFKFEWLQETRHFINHAYCWYNPQHVESGEVAQLFSPVIAMGTIPGKPIELCGNEYLEPEDFWCDDWGEQPPVYFPDESDSHSFLEED